jgi:methyl-accepting chemotaxis protein
MGRVLNKRGKYSFMTQGSGKPGRRGLFKSIGSRLVAVISLQALALVAIVALLTWQAAQSIYSAREDELQTVTQVAYKVIEEQYQQFKAGKVSEAEAQERAKAAVRAMRYNVEDYFFVQNNDGITIVHGVRPDQENILSKLALPDGRLLTAVFHEICVTKGSGFASYEYAKPGAPLDQPSPKLSFVKWFAPWQWVVGTGVYIDDLNVQIWHKIYVSAAIGLGFLIAIGGLASFILLGMSRRLTKLSAAMVSLAQGESGLFAAP